MPMLKNINEIEFSVFDLETTGLTPESGDRIVEIAAVRLRHKHKHKHKQRLEVFQSLVNPGERRISPAAFVVNQITPEMLKDAPDISEVMPSFLDFISESCLAAYNAPFDFAFLSSESNLINCRLPERLQIVDILIMAKRMLPGLGSYSLGFVAKTLGIDSLQKHRALSDAQLAAEVFNRLNSTLIGKGVVDFEQFVSLFGLNSQLLDNINSAKIAQIQRALDLGVSLKIRYLSGAGAKLTEREVIPKAIIQKGGAIRDYRATEKEYDVSKGVYLVGFCNLRRQERTFRIDNILNLEIGEDKCLGQK